METKEFDKAVVAALFQQAGLIGWRSTTLIDAAREAGLDDLSRLRLRFPTRTAALLRFGIMADQAALEAMQPTGTPREKLFDLLMTRFDLLQQHRGGMLALIAALRTDPALAAMIWTANLRSMRWMLDAAGVPSGGLSGALRMQGLAAVWAYALRAWERDEGADLPATMAAVDRGLDRAVQAEDMLPGRRPSTPEPMPESMSEPGSAPAQPPIPALLGTDVAASDGGAAVL